MNIERITADIAELGNKLMDENGLGETSKLEILTALAKATEAIDVMGEAVAVAKTAVEHAKEMIDGHFADRATAIAALVKPVSVENKPAAEQVEQTAVKEAA